MPEQFERDVHHCLNVLRKGGIILYPTDTIWGLGCDATNAKAVKRIYEIKKREETKSLIVLLGDVNDIINYVADPDLEVFDFLEKQSRPTTVIFENAVGLPENVIAMDGSIGIRIVRDDFCRHLIKRLQKPLISTSANRSGEPSPLTFSTIAKEILDAADYVVRWRQDETEPAQPSQIIQWLGGGSYRVIRS